jgi:tol-pal system protein YbgF
MKPSRILLLALSAASLMAAAWPAAAQEPPVDQSTRDRIDRLEKQLHEVRDIVLQARATGQPVEIKEAGPDPEVTALSAKFDDMNQTLSGLNGQVETLTHDLDLARKDAADAKAAVADLAGRVDALEKAVAAMNAPPPAAEAAPPAEAPGPPPPGEDPKAAYAHARQLMMDGDYAAASAAFQDYVDHYGDAPNIAEARYWLGETKYAQEDYQGAAVAYLGATHGWPQTAWGADAEVKLALSLLQLNKPAAACATLDEFGHHYAKAGASAKDRAAAARIKAKCGA